MFLSVKNYIKMKISIVVTLLLISILMLNCKDNVSSENPLDKTEYALVNQEDMAVGFQLLENNCFSCHSPSASIDNRIAPPMEAIKKHYIEENTSIEDFTTDLLSFMNNPTKETSKMPGAIKRFGLMPKMNFSENQLSQIASYIYNTELEKPDWFDKHYEEERKKHRSTTALSPLEKGQNIAMKTKGVLGKNLLSAINSKGTENALAFCSNKAIALTDSMAASLDAKVKRVSDRNRNPKNKANAAELAYIESAKEALSNGEKILPQLTTIGNQEIGYYPIMTSQMCMQCHGQKNKEVVPATLAKIEQLYPKDLATGYKVNELRGIWVVEMEKTTEEF